jgi:hypothetical protein
MNEFFYLVDGELMIALEDRTVALAPRHGRNAGIIPTGD